MLTRSDYQIALGIQNACNLSGVVFTFARIMERLCEEASDNGHGTEWKNTHPIVQLFADKLADLARIRDFETYYAAHTTVQNKIEEMYAE
jgi:hypothetical protein